VDTLQFSSSQLLSLSLKARSASAVDYSWVGWQALQRASRCRVSAAELAGKIFSHYPSAKLVARD